ncbi:MAG: bifunctional glutamate N-acetyltransferase/amino-acid acetyltransferase ArgJ [Verrucomicrobiales bacterium]|nr:bifunctional glutamate N-acetyltransferase/amino-acid acetyltransferase ArgJ [Verrucomicrobiales bacterium]
MSKPTKSVPVAGSVVAPRGFRAAGVFCDIKRLGTGKGSDKGAKPDLALIVSDVPAAVAGMFTTNQVCAAPVKLCVPRVRTGTAQAVVVNSGNANACTGPQGFRDAQIMARETARRCGLEEGAVLVGSTGRIGVPLPMPNIRRGIGMAAAGLGSTPAHADQAAEAILTSDTRAKQVAREFSLGGRPVRLGGICKGAGMIQPGMSANGSRPAAGSGGLHATMLAFLTCDAAVVPPLLQAMLAEAVARSFNRITVDGDMSTNDTVLLLANGLAGNPVLRLNSRQPERRRDREVLQEALNGVCLELAKMIVRDGEGISRVVTVRVSGARTDAEAELAARAVGNSALVKTSWHGGDPNWGRIMDALGYSAARVEEGRVDIAYSAPGQRARLFSLKQGRPTRTSFETLCAAVAPTEFELHINLNLGRGRTVLYAADLTEAYVDFNKGNVNDPASLGG